jgi:hypothetical protein
MIKKVFLSLFVVYSLGISLYGFSLGESSCDYTNIAETDNSTMVTNLQQSASLLEISQNLVTLSTTLLNNSSTTNIIYVNAMLSLSNDIGAMANRIGEMADRIIATELQIGIMADRIMQTQELQSKNLALTQANILKAQQNFQTLLINLAQ